MSATQNKDTGLVKPIQLPKGDLQLADYYTHAYFSKDRILGQWEVQVQITVSHYYHAPQKYHLWGAPVRKEIDVAANKIQH